MEVLKQASWGATRDNMALGTKANGIDGAHLLRPKVHLYTTGKVIQNNQPLPMYTLLNLNYDCQGLSVSNEYKDLKVGTDCSALKEAFAKKKAAGKEVKVAMTFPGGTHDLWIRYWLAAGGIDPDKDVSTIVVPPAADGCQHEGRQHGRLLRRRAVERAARQPGHRLHRRHHRRDLVQASREGARHARRLGRRQPEGRARHHDGDDGGPAVVREDGEQAGDGRDHRPPPVVQRAGARHHRPHQGRHQLRPRPHRARAPTC